MPRLKTRILQFFFPRCIWYIPKSPSVYITFDDGPHPVTTSIALAVLKKHQIKAVFFCVGSQVEKYPDLYQQIIAQGHTVGNHTFSHENGWTTPQKDYIESVRTASKVISSRLFRPPYGKITFSKTRKIRQLGYKMIMWSWMSYDFILDNSLEKHTSRIHQISAGDILVFHDNAKTMRVLERYLELTFEYLSHRNIPTQLLNP